MKIYLVLLMFVLFACKENKLGQIDKTVIPVADAIGTGEILNLSDYAKSVKYIPLETNDSVLIGKIEELIYENGHIALYDSQNKQCRLFDENGCYKKDLGHIGHGPDEYTFIRAMSITPEPKQIFLSTNQGYFLYDLNGDFKKRIQRVEVPTPFFEPATVPITSDVYFSFLSATNNFKYKGLIWGKKDSSEIYRLQPNFIDWDYSEGRKSYSVTTYKWRFKDQYRCYWKENDTIFTIGSDLEIKQAFTFDFGIYKAPLKWLLDYTKEIENSKKITIGNSIYESTDYLFFSLSLYSLAPEPVTYKIRNPRGYMQTITDRSVRCLFNKKYGKLTLLNRPIKNKKYLGFRNDMDGGPAFWPLYISSEDEMLSWFSAEEFLEIYEQLHTPSDELKTFAEKLKPDDNPVLMVVRLK